MLKKLFCVFLAALCLLTGCSLYKDSVVWNTAETYTAVIREQMKDTAASREDFLKAFSVSTKFLPKNAGTAYYYLICRTDASTPEHGRISWYGDDDKSFHIYLDEERYVANYDFDRADAQPSQIRNTAVTIFCFTVGDNRLTQAEFAIDGYQVTVLFQNHTDEEIQKLLRNIIKYN